MLTYLPTMPTFTRRESDSTRLTSASQSEMSIRSEAGVAEGLDDGHVGVGHVDVLADDAHLHAPRERLDPVDERLPVGDVDPIGSRRGGGPRRRTCRRRAC